MGTAISFDELLEAVEHLSLDAQESFIDVLRHRIAEHRRREIHGLILSARKEYSSGKLTPETPQNIMEDILS